jgi:hypothetical protein
VLKGGGGEAERNPAKAVEIHLWDAAQGRAAQMLPALTQDTQGGNEPDIASIWACSVRNATIEARVVATIALGLIALRQGGDHEAQLLWETRRAIT